MKDDFHIPEGYWDNLFSDIPSSFKELEKCLYDHMKQEQENLAKSLLKPKEQTQFK
jgi:hypothetical protein